MPLINPDEIIKDNFKILSRQRKSSRPKKGAKNETEQIFVQPHYCEPISTPLPLYEDSVKPFYAQAHFEEVLPDKPLPQSWISTSTEPQLSEKVSISHGDDFSTDSVYILEEQADKSSSSSAIVQISDTVKKDSTQVKLEPIVEIVNEDTKVKPGAKEAHKLNEILPSKRSDNNRRRNTLIPCSCPQYKVSRDLSTKWDLQGIFFGKILVVKIIQLFVINLITLTLVFESGRSSKFFLKCHDWAYLTYGIFVGLLLFIRWGLGYRSRWPLAVSLVMMTPLTLIIAFMCACITCIYYSMLIPMVTCILFLTFIMLCFAPYMLRKSVMHRSTNLAACALTLFCSITLIFLKEFEIKPVTYWQFTSRVWLPAMMLSQIAVQITVFEIQRIIFGLCFNVSTKRWHIAALYI